MTIEKFFDIPFANGGSQTTIPDPTQSGGEVSFTQGYGPDYSAAPASPGVLYPQSGEFNYLMYAITSALNLWQTHSFCDWISSSVNGGSPYPYDANVPVRYTDGNIWISLVSSNTTTPGADPTKWGLFSFFPSNFYTGMTIIHEDINLPAGGWIWCNGLTVGNASSNATGRANADTQAIFTQIWGAFPNAVRQLYNSSGTAISRGVSAAADWAANNALPVRDMRDVVPAGTATMGGTSNRGLLTGYRQGVDGSVYGSTGGEQSHTPIIDETAEHQHDQYVLSSFTGGGSQGAARGGGFFSGTTIGSPGTLNTGSGENFNIVQPTTICNWITKL